MNHFYMQFYVACVLNLEVSIKGGRLLTGVISPDFFLDIYHIIDLLFSPTFRPFYSQ